MEMKIVYGILLFIAGILSAIVTMINKKKGKGIVVTIVIAVIGFVIGSLEFLSLVI